MKIVLATIVTVALAAPAAAQRPLPPPPSSIPAISLRPFLLVTEQNFTAAPTFKAVFGQSFQPFLGGGLQVALRNGFSIDLTASRFMKDGQRAFALDGKTYRLGFPLTVTETALELTGGYRFNNTARLVPYFNAGVGSYHYNETAPSSTEPGENLDAKHSGYIVAGGLEFRAGRWLGLGVDAQYTHIPDILGAGGLSQSLKDTDLGGTSLRLRVIVGR